MAKKNPGRRIGYSRMADIPPAFLKKLNSGEVETITLVEWLAIDIRRLARAMATQVGMEKQEEELGRRADALAVFGVEQRTRGMGAALFEVANGRRDREKLFERVAAHPSDMVRSWAAYWLGADRSLPLKERLERTKRFAADPAMSVRECAWSSYREYLAADLDRGFKLLRPWVRHAHEGVRRCAIESTRPRGVWTRHITALKDDPARALPLLEAVRSDSSRYVQRAVANWLNDASKSKPAWVRKLCTRWKKESPTPETAWIINHALRTLRKEAEKK